MEACIRMKVTGMMVSQVASARPACLHAPRPPHPPPHQTRLLLHHRLRPRPYLPRLQVHRPLLSSCSLLRWPGLDKRPPFMASQYVIYISILSLALNKLRHYDGRHLCTRVRNNPQQVTTLLSQAAVGLLRMSSCCLDNQKAMHNKHILGDFGPQHVISNAAYHALDAE